MNLMILGMGGVFYGVSLNLMGFFFAVMIKVFQGDGLQLGLHDGLSTYLKRRSSCLSGDMNILYDPW